MPVSSGTQLNLPRAIAFGVGSLVVGLGLIFLLVQVAGSGDVQFKLGDDIFNAGSAVERAERIQDDGEPIIFSSLSRDRPLYLQHEGTEADRGWSAFDARSPDAPEDCVLQWASDGFVDSCDASRTWPANGEGLLQYDVTISAEGDLLIDLNANTDTDGGTSDTTDDG